MNLRSTLNVTAHHRAFVLIVEPWANEFQIAVGEKCEIIALHPSVIPTFGAEVSRDGDFMVWVNDSGATFEFWRSGKREFRTQVAIP